MFREVDTFRKPILILVPNGRNRDARDKVVPSRVVCRIQECVENSVGVCVDRDGCADGEGGARLLAPVRGGKGRLDQGGLGFTPRRRS